MKVAITLSAFAEYDKGPLEALAALETVFNPYGRTLSAAEARELLRGCAGVLAGTEPLGRETLAALPELKVISRCGSGLDNVDLEAAAGLGLKVYSTPEGPAQAVAELTLGLALDLARHISRHDRELRAGLRRKRLGRLLSGQRVGVIGCGRIGRRSAALFQAVGCEIAVSDPAAPAGPWPNRPLPELLEWAEGLLLHCPAQPRPLLGRAELARLRPGAWLVNAARDGLVDLEGLAEALASGRLAGAALDIDGPGPLAGLDNALITPHIGSYARESRAAMEREAVENLLGALAAL